MDGFSCWVLKLNLLTFPAPFLNEVTIYLFYIFCIVVLADGVLIYFEVILGRLIFKFYEIGFLLFCFLWIRLILWDFDASGSRLWELGVLRFFFLEGFGLRFTCHLTLDGATLGCWVLNLVKVYINSSSTSSTLSNSTSIFSSMLSSSESSLYSKGPELGPFGLSNLSNTRLSNLTGSQVWIYNPNYPFISDVPALWSGFYLLNYCYL